MLESSEGSSLSSIAFLKCQFEMYNDISVRNLRYNYAIGFIVLLQVGQSLRQSTAKILILRIN